MELKDIYELIETFKKSDLEALELKHEKTELVLKRPSSEPVMVTQMAAPQIQPMQVENVQTHTEKIVPEQQQVGTPVHAPLVGVFYAAPAPDKPAFVAIGDTVRKGQVLCVIEAMKTMNEIVAPADGVIVDILVENEAIVAYDAPLFMIGA